MSPMILRRVGTRSGDFRLAVAAAMPVIGIAPELNGLMRASRSGRPRAAPARRPAMP